MRLWIWRRIHSFIIYYRLPAIWFTINPNDLINLIKFYLLDIRSDITDQIVSLLQNNYKRIKVAIKDPINTIIFFY